MSIKNGGINAKTEQTDEHLSLVSALMGSGKAGRNDVCTVGTTLLSMYLNDLSVYMSSKTPQ